LETEFNLLEIETFGHSIPINVLFIIKALSFSVQKVPTIEKVEDAVKTRLEMIIPYLPRWSEAMAISSLPHNIPTTLAALLTMVDDVCYYSGDKSVDVSCQSYLLVMKEIR